MIISGNSPYITVHDSKWMEQKYSMVHNVVSDYICKDVIKQPL